MKRVIATVLAIGCMVVAGIWYLSARQAVQHSQNIADLQALGGTVLVDPASPGAPVTSLVLSGTMVTDADLNRLKELRQLQILSLNNTKITDSGLECLRGLTELTALGLGLTKVTDAGLKNLMGLSRLSELDLAGTQVSDAGLDSLSGLTGLRQLQLANTQVTEAGVKKLQQALPSCKITH
jgi:internalin A